MGQEFLIREMAEQLDTVKQLTVPSVALSQLLIDRLPESADLLELALKQESDIEGLTKKTIALIDDWYRNYVRPVNQALVEADTKTRSISLQMNARLADDAD